MVKSLVLLFLCVFMFGCGGDADVVGTFYLQDAKTGQCLIARQFYGSGKWVITKAEQAECSYVAP